jgi:uncharacterized coiled-coil protein SlyX
MNLAEAFSVAAAVATAGVAIGLSGVSLFRRSPPQDTAREELARRVTQQDAEIAELRERVASNRLEIGNVKKNLAALQEIVDELDRDVLNAVLGINERFDKHVRNKR